MITRYKKIFPTAILLLFSAALFALAGETKQNKKANNPANAAGPAQLGTLTPSVGHAVGFAETRPLRDLLAEVGITDAELVNEFEEINRLNMGDFGTPNPRAPVQRDGALQSYWRSGYPSTPAVPAPILTFEGIPVQSSAPPDTEGAVGPNDYVQTVNTTNRIFDKAGVPRGPTFKMSTLFAPVGGVCATNDSGDPLVLYDRISNRWVLSQFAFASQTAPPYHQCVAVSKNGDPTGAYWAYDFVTGGTTNQNDFPDYGKIGTWPDGYYFTDRQFTLGANYNGFGCYAFDRAKMLVGDPTATYVYFNAGPALSQASSGMIPSDYNGLTPPPAGAPNVFSVFTDDAFVGDTADTLRLFNFHAVFGGAGSTFTERPESPLAVASFDSRSPNGRADIEQPPPATAADYVDSIGDRLMLRLQYFNRGGTETLTSCHTVNAGVIPAPGISPTVAEYRAATRYYILQKTTPGGTYSVQDQSTFSPDTVERWMGSTAVDNAGNLAVGYSVSNTSVFPGIRYAGRLLGDPPNSISGEQVMFAGSGVQIGTANRWGDYSNMSLDPVDDATFWYTQEYYAASPPGGFGWQTRVGAFKFAGTVAPAQGTLAGTVTACDSGALIADALVQVTGGPSFGFSSTTKPDGTYSMKLTPGSYSATIIDPAHSCAAIGPFNVTITNGNTTTLNGCLTGTPKFDLGAKTVSGGNGDSSIDRNECVNLNVSVVNIGCLIAPNVTATLSTTTPNVTISQPNSAYPTLSENATQVNTTPYQVSTSAAFACGTTINFQLSINSPSGGSIVIPFSLPSCVVPTATINGALAAGDLQQPTGRLGRNGLVSGCGSAKACPGPLGAGPRLYDQYTFTNGPLAACVTIATTQSCPTPANDIIPAAYLTAYDPNNFCTNYLGDPGGSPGVSGNSFSVDVPAGATLVVIVQEANAGLAGCSGYQLMISGLVGNTSGPGPCTGGVTPTPTPTPGTPTPTPTPLPPTPTPTPTPIPCSGGGYVFSASLGNAIVPGTTDTGNHGDDVVTAIALPFPVNFYGDVFVSARVSSNGNVQFIGSSTYIGPTCPFPDPNLAEAILAYQDDLRTDGAGGGIFTSVSGVAPNRIFNIEWRTTYFGRAGTANFEVRLYENSTKVDVIYGATADNGEFESSGVQRTASGPSTQYSCNEAFLFPGLKVTYTCGTPGPTPVVHVRSTPSRTREGLSASFVVEADRVLTRSIVVNYSMSGNAILDDDYSLTPDCCQVTILAGQMRTPVVLDAFADGISERRGETATMNLKPGPGYVVTTSRRPPTFKASIKIVD